MNTEFEQNLVMKESLDYFQALIDKRTTDYKTDNTIFKIPES